MDTVGVRELKTHLSRHLRRVRSGQRLLVTEWGRSVAVIAPVDAPENLGWAHQMVAEGLAGWTGGKPVGVGGHVAGPVSRTVSDAVLEDRR